MFHIEISMEGEMDVACYLTVRLIFITITCLLKSGDDDLTIADAGITDDSNLFVWDGVQVAGEAVQVGAYCEPVLLHVTYPAPSSVTSDSSSREGCEYELVSGFPKNSTLRELRVSKLKY